MEGKRDVTIHLQGKLPTLTAPLKMYQSITGYKQLVKHFISRDLKIRYHNSIIGYGWSILEPLALTFTFYILFAILSNDNSDPYRPLTILLGLLAWSLFGKTLLYCTTSLQKNASLIKSVFFPRELFLFSKVGYQIIQFSLSIIVVIPLLYVYDLVPNYRFLYLPIAILFISLFTLGVAFFTAILQTIARDVEHIVSITIRIGFYLTPVFYPLSMITGGRIPEKYSAIYLMVNPMATYITMIRSAFTGEPLGISNDSLAFTLISTILLFWIGSIYFLRNERKAVKRI